MALSVNWAGKGGQLQHRGEWASPSIKGEGEGGGRIHRRQTSNQDLGWTIDWTNWSTPRRGDSAFISGLRPLFSSMQSLFRSRMGDGASFRFWEDDSARIERLRDLYPRLHALALDPGVSVKSVSDAGWFPTLPSSISDQQF